jgi:hypothetical protein
MYIDHYAPCLVTVNTHAIMYVLVYNIGNLTLPSLRVCTGFDHNINECLFFAGYKINHDIHEFILDSGTVANT